MAQRGIELLKRLAKRYVWWKTPEEAVRFQRLLVAQVMNIGDYEDVEAFVQSVGDDYLREVIAHAEIGQFNAPSWHYWLGLAQPSQVPPLSERRIT